MENKIKRIQEIELEMLKKIDEICKENQITYYALGGTLLGAVRHEGFIPWDDDVDLGFPRKDFEKFELVAQKHLPDHLILEKDPVNLNTLHLVNKNTLVQKGKKTTGLYIDIFPLDGYPNNFIEKKLYSFRILLRRMLAKLSVLEFLVDRDRGWKENFIIRVGKWVNVSKILNTNTQLNQLHRIVKKYDFENSILSGNILGRYREKEIVPTDFFGTPKKLIFETMELCVPEKYEEYLSAIYGDYMKLPPEEDRVLVEVKIIKVD